MCPGDRPERGLQDPFELDEWFFEERDVIEIRAGDASFGQTEADGALGESEIVLDSAEPLSFSRRKDLAVPISEAKLPQTRVARLEKAVTQLRALPGPGR